MVPIWFFKWHIADVKNISSILNAGVTIGSIVIAFLATMISILITLSNADVMKRISKTDSEGMLTSYIKVPIVSGFILAIYSMILYMFTHLSNTISNILLMIFVSLLTFFILSSYRIINIFLRMLQNVLIENKPNSKEKPVFAPKIRPK